jgi:RHS repeat-associated protein
MPYGYRFGFNGKENDNEVHGAIGTFQDYGERMYDTRIGRFPSVDPLTKKFAMLTPYQFASNTPIWAIDLDGKEAWIFTETDGVGHAWIVVPSASDVHQYVAYSYGRYNGSTTPSLGEYGPSGEGVLIRHEGQAAANFIKERLSLENGTSTFVFYAPQANAQAIREHYDAQFNCGDKLPPDSRAGKQYGDDARIVSMYTLTPQPGGDLADNCATKTVEGIVAGHAFDNFKPSSEEAYNYLLSQLDPKALGGFLYMMSAQDAKANPGNRTIVEMTGPVKQAWGVTPAQQQSPAPSCTDDGCTGN